MEKNNINYTISSNLAERVRNAIDMNLKTQIKKIMPSLHPADQADVIRYLNKNERAELIKMLGNQLDPETLLELQEDLRNEVISLINKNDLVSILSKLDVDDIVYILEDVDDKDFVKEIGKSDLPGRPNLYGITNQFLDYFGLSSKEDLPKIEDTKANEDDVDLYESKYKEVEVEEL